MIFLKLFLTFFKIGLFSFGGGYGMLPLILQETVKNGWLTESEFYSFLAVAESTPGPIAVNMATYVGSTQGMFTYGGNVFFGILGSTIATLGVIMPSIIIILLIVAVLKNFLQYRAVRCALMGMKPLICGMIMATGITLAITNILPNLYSFSFKGFSYMALIVTAILAGIYFGYKKLFKKNLSPILLILISAVFGILLL